MQVIDLHSGDLSLRVSPKGGLLLGFCKGEGSTRVPLLRAAPLDAGALSSSCYPLVPFGNRVKDNHFFFNNSEYRFTPNTDWDAHYLHGDGWQADWIVDAQSQSSVEMSYRHEGGSRTPYVYTARQHFELTDDDLAMTLTVSNDGERPLPFGLGWHPYFPMTAATTLFAPARKYWTEIEGWLPGEATSIPEDVDFSEPKELPHRWVNNGFESWSGEAVIRWPERRTDLQLTADPIFKHAFVFVSDTSFDPNFKRDYFCFEPMTHLANGHNLPGLGDLKILSPGQALSGGIRLRPGSL
ncbi:aldose 1-epimerase [Rhizobium leguminosarum]|uniref:Aldose 1-epimerase n=1 Tax=Rhizobium leguminosarum TaxID=384 RepID=A0A7W9ZY41_RHILE|nr:aldose 1-epimerase [Rhizobium leguminosarum]MBB6224928.1 aldose 1-epimerase [Rhizobium leguminosarum]